MIVHLNGKVQKLIPFFDDENNSVNIRFSLHLSSHGFDSGFCEPNVGQRTAAVVK